MPLSQEEMDRIDESIRKVKSERSSQQGILRGIITRIRILISTIDKSKEKECHALCEKLNAHKDKHDSVYQEVMRLLTVHQRSTIEVEDKYKAIVQEINDIQDKANDWFLSLDELTFSSTPECPTTYTLEAGLNQSITDNDDQVEALTKRLVDMKSRLDSYSDTQFQIEQLRSTMQDMADKRDKDVDAYERRLQDMKMELSRERLENERLKTQVTQVTSTPRSDNPRRSSFGYGPRDESRGIEPDDLFAISHIVAQSNTEMMKQMLDRSADNNKTFFQTLQTPKVELPVFDGSYTEYHAFMNKFNDLVGSTDATDSVKLNTLIQHCSSVVKKHLECCNYKPSTEGYALALKILKKKYGNSFLISQAWVDKVLQYPKLKDPDELLLFSSELKSCHESLSALGFLSDMENTANMREKVNKIPIYMQQRWRKHYREKLAKEERATLLQLINIISEASEEQADPLYGAASLNKMTSRGDRSERVDKDSTKKKFKKTSVNTACAAADVTTEKPSVDKEKRKIKCTFCGEGHYSRLCPRFESKSPLERLKMINEKKMCVLCLNPFHQVDTCNLKWKCQEPSCGQRHNTSLHQAYAVLPESQKKDASSSLAMTEGENEDDEASYFLNESSMHSQSGEAYSLPVVPIHVEGKDGIVIETNALMDTGATLTFITRDLFRRLKLVPYRTDTLTLTSMTDKSSFVADLVNFNIKPTDNNKWVTTYGVAVVDTLPVSGKYVRHLRCLDQWDYLKELQIKVAGTESVDILVGQNNAKLFKRQIEVHGPEDGMPYAIRTLVGWMIMGHYISVKKSEPQPRVEHVHVCSTDVHLDRRLDMMWQVESVPEIKQEDPINIKIEKMWDEKSVVQDGHLYVPIPFKTEPPCLPNNKEVVEKRMNSLKRRMQKDTVVHDKCMETMANDFKKGYAEIAPDEPDPDYLWYVPIQPVITYTDKRPGKCRLVGDISIIFQGKCLNEEVYPGPNKTSSLYNMLIMFRQYQHAITGDLKEMFNQVRVPETQRDCLRFLWWLDGIDNPPTECRMITQMFGGTWCPSVCQYALEWVARHPQAQYEYEVIQTILKHFYVDDMLRSIWDEEIGYRLLMGARALLAEIGFDLTKLGSSSMAILERIPEELRAKEYKEVVIEVGDGVTSLALGSVWRPGKDVFGFKTVDKEKPATKRGVLSIATSLFDPIGLIAPFILRAKMLIQELCKEGLAWDDPLPGIYNKEWVTWIEELPVIQEFNIPRWIGMSKDPGLVYTLHVFTDASSKGYGAAIYLVVSNEGEEVLSSRLVTSKAKVAPIKPMTIPRMELCACVLGVKLERSIRENLGADLSVTCFWTDSTIVLWYIRGQAWKYKTFVSNRVGYIQERTQHQQWFYIPTDQNVADYTSRGMSAQEMVDSTVWKEGPIFLVNPALQPEQPELTVLEKDDEIKRRKDVVFVSIVDKSVNNRNVKQIFLNHYSDWRKAVLHTCIWRRISVYAKTGKYPRGFCTVEERRAAELQVFRLIQEIHLTEQQCQKKIFHKLFPFDEDGLHRVGGRLHLSSYDMDVKHPPILPASGMTQAFIRYHHHRCGHCGVDRTFHEVKKHVWLLGGKKTVRGAIGDCVDCGKLKNRLGQQIMSPLPEFRIERGTVPFDVVGVDCFGPVYVKVNRGTQKRQLCLFTDLKIRAAHVEVVHDMTTAAFIMALQRFIARRGKPSLIVSDNGSNFIGAKRELKEAFRQFDQDRIGTFLAENRIRWQCNTPLASHHGGAWERLIRTFRMLFLSVAGSQRLNDESLLTFVANTEQMMNSRPLTRLTEDIADDEVLTPEHLINQRPAECIPGNYTSSDALRSRWKQVLYLSEKFWTKWIDTYVQTLQLRHKWVKPMKDLKVDDIVLVKDESVHRLHWPLGRVLEVFPGKDGHVRSARIKTQTGDYQRPISKLIFLECS